VKVGADARVGAGVRLGPDAVVPARGRIPSHRTARTAA
jgi:acetyltransferase-like isoleucine patch superfamily enzyme